MILNRTLNSLCHLHSKWLGAVFLLSPKEEFLLFHSYNQYSKNSYKEMSTTAAKTSLNHSQTLVFSQLSFLPVCPYNPPRAQLGQVQSPAHEYRLSRGEKAESSPEKDSGCWLIRSSTWAGDVHLQNQKANHQTGKTQKNLQILETFFAK